MAYTPLTTQVAGGVASAAGWANLVKGNFESMGPHLLTPPKPSDESVASSTTLQNDDHLFFTVAANEKWLVEFVLIYDAPTAADIKLAFTFPSGRVDFSTVWVDETGTATFRQWNTATSPTTAVALFGAGSPMTFPLKGVFANGATPGNLQLQWAQNTSNASATTMKTHSSLWGMKLA